MGQVNSSPDYTAMTDDELRRRHKLANDLISDHLALHQSVFERLDDLRQTSATIYEEMLKRMVADGSGKIFRAE